MLRTKYHSSKQVYEWIKFDSKLELRFYKYFIEKWIEILELQPRFILQEKFRYDGVAIREIAYVSDFKIQYKWDVYYVDSKGMRTPDFKIKYKMWLCKYGKENRLLVCSSLKELEKILN